MSKLTPKAKMRSDISDMVAVTVKLPEEILTLITPPGATASDTIRAVIGGIAESRGVDLRYYPTFTRKQSFLSSNYVEIGLLDACYDTIDLPCAVPQGIEDTDPYKADNSTAASNLYDMDSYAPRAGRTNPLGSTLSRLRTKQRELADEIARMRNLKRYDSVYVESGRPTKKAALAELERICTLLPSGSKEAVWGWISVDVLIEVMESYAKALRIDLEARRDLDHARLSRAQRSRAERVYREGVVSRERAVVNGIEVKRRRRAVPQETSSLFPSWAVQEEEALLGEQLRSRYGAKKTTAETRYAAQERRIERKRVHELEEQVRLAREEVAARSVDALPIAKGGVIQASYPDTNYTPPYKHKARKDKRVWEEGTPKRAYYDRKMRERKARKAKQKEES